MLPLFIDIQKRAFFSFLAQEIFVYFSQLKLTVQNFLLKRWYKKVNLNFSADYFVQNFLINDLMYKVAP